MINMRRQIWTGADKYAIKEWNKLDPENRNAETYASFQ